MTNFEQTVKDLNQLITTDNTLKAMDLYYADNVTMQENEDPPRIGKQVCIEHERNNLGNVKGFKLTITNQAIGPINQVVFNEFDIGFETLKGIKMRLKEVSVQHWENGQIINEKFYYKSLIPINSLKNGKAN